MEKQSTSKFLRSVIAVVALFMLVVSGLFLASCKEEECSHSTTNDFGACTECNVIVDWAKYEAKLDGLISPNFTDLTASLDSLKSEVSDVASDVDSVIAKIGDIDLGADITTIVDTVKDIRDEVVALLGAEEVTNRATPATITGIAKALDALQASVNKVQEDITGVEKVCKDHDFDTETLIEIIPASCTENGLGYYRCKNCNAVISQPIEAKGHTEVVTETPVTAGDCTSQITVTTTCSVCNETLKTETKDGYAEHEWVIDEESSTATCTEAGKVTYTCAHEGCTVTKEEDVEALGHTPDEGEVTTQPTCTTEGVKTFTCTRCDVVVGTEAVEMVPHTYPVENRVWKYTGEIKFGQNHSGTVVDIITQTQYDVCSVCGHEEVVMKEDGKTPVTQDTYHSLYLDTELTFAEGNGRVVDTVTMKEDVTKYGLQEGGVNHDKIVNNYANLSCTSEAKLYYICADTDCPVKHNAPITVDLPALDHVWVDDTAKEDVPATCTSTGIHYEVCSACGTTHEVVTDKIPHTYDDAVIVDATCGVEGSKTYTCNVCGDEIVEKIPALEHNYVAGETKVVYVDDATHEVTTVYTCSNCQDSYEDVNYVAHDKTGYNTLEEAEAAKKYNFNIYQAADGKFYFTDASCDDPGVRIYLCECGYWYEDTYFATKYVEQLGHDWSEGVYIEGSCVTAGKIQYTCERCGEIYIETVQTATGHKWDKAVAPKAPTCTVAGTKGYLQCSVCGEIVAWDGVEANKASVYSTDYIDYEAEGYESAEDWAYIAPTGHVFDTPFILRDLYGCESPVWKVMVCGECLESEDNKAFVIKQDPTGFTQDETTYIATDLSAAEGYVFEEGKDLAWYINDLLKGLNFLDNNSFTADMIVDGAVLKGWNFTGITFVPAAGHELNKTQSDGKTDAIVCLTDKALVTYTDALEFAKKVYGSVNETDFKAAFNAIFGDGAADNTEFKIDVTGETTPTLAGICTECGMPVETVPHDEQYYMFELGYDAGTLTEPKYTPYDYTVALEGVGEDGVNVNKVIVNTQKYLVKDAEGNMLYADEKAIADNKYTKVVFTLDEIISMGYYNMDEHNEFMAVNCYFEGFCARNCGTDLGHKSEHTFPTSDNYDKYHNCMHGDICVWCTNLMRNADEHNLQNLEEISAYGDRYAAAVEKLYNSGFEWVGKDTVGEVDCKNEGKDYTITVCVSCLLAWAEGDPNFDTWTENVNYTSKVELANGDHKFVLVKSGDPNSKNCLVGYFEKYVCEVCGYQLEHTDTFEYAEQEINSLNEFDYVAETYLPTKLHTVAPVAGYWLNDNYEAATDADPAYMNFICVDCGARIQGYYDGVNDAGEVVYNMATVEQINAYLATAGTDDDKVAKWGNIQVVRAVDKAAVTTIEFAAGATDAEKVDAVADAIADAEAEGATSVYLTIPGDIKFGASDTTTFTEGEVTVWQAYGITFSADSSVKKIVLDLGGNTLTFAGTTVDKESKATVGATYEINGEGSVIFSNGTIEFTAFTKDQNTFAFKANTAGLVFDNITATVKGGATFAGFGSNGEEAVGTMTIKESTITTEGYYVVSTNASKSASSKVVINIIDSTLTSTQPDNDSVGIMFNVPGELNVSGSFVTADSQGMIIRGGNVKATIKDTEVTITGDCSEANVEGYDKFESDNWATGNGVPMGAFVIGNRNTDGYQAGLATVVLEEVTINAPKDVNKVYVYAQEGDTTVDLTITNCGLEAADIVGSKVTANADVYKLTIDGAQVLPAPVVDEGNTEEAQG